MQVMNGNPSRKDHGGTFTVTAGWEGSVTSSLHYPVLAKLLPQTRLTLILKHGNKSLKKKLTNIIGNF